MCQIQTIKEISMKKTIAEAVKTSTKQNGTVAKKPVGFLNKPSFSPMPKKPTGNTNQPVGCNKDFRPFLKPLATIQVDVRIQNG